MELKGDIFYLLKTETKKTIFGSKAEAISALKQALADDKNLDIDSVEIREANTAPEDDNGNPVNGWALAEMPWSTIAKYLLGRDDSA